MEASIYDEFVNMRQMSIVSLNIMGSVPPDHESIYMNLRDAPLKEKNFRDALNP